MGSNMILEKQRTIKLELKHEDAVWKDIFLVIKEYKKHIDKIFITEK
jgi:hypothetical protein